MDDVLIVGSLDDKALRKSIDELVKYVGGKTKDMAEDFTEGLDKMTLAMKDFAISQKVSVTLMKEAWRDMSASFDAMVAAQSGATGSGKGKGQPEEGTVGWLKQESKIQGQIVDQQKLGTAELQKEVDHHERIKAYLKDELKSTKQRRFELANSLKINNLDEAERKLRFLETLQRRYAGTIEFSVAEQNKLARAIENCKKQIAKFNSLRPKTMTEVLGMSEKGVDAISAKMRELKRLQVDPNNVQQVKMLGDQYQRLARLQAELLGRNIQLTHSNNYLAQSFGYIRNRIVYALTLGAITNFVKQIYEVRGQYELLERSLGVLIGSFERGSQIFRELNAMAIKSPFTLLELAGAAKQLTAYNFAANEVVDTTRRLADISAALGVPMERLTYNLGQIRAQTVLTARDARDFANAGLPIVKSLSDYYTELEGRVVSTGDVYDRMSKKMVSYNDVMAVLNKMTDEGGKFFDFQAKQAETLRVQINNLTLAWNNMLNDVGKSNQGILTLPVKGLKMIFQNWKSIDNTIWDVITALGIFKATQTIYAIYANKVGLVNLKYAEMYKGGQKIVDVAKKIGVTMRDAFFNPATWISLVAVAVIDLGWSLWEAHKAAKALNEEIRKSASESLKSINDFLLTYNSLRNTISQIKSKSDVGSLSVEESEKAWANMREQIQNSTAASDAFIAKLESVTDVNKRLSMGFDMIDKIKAVNAALESLGDTAITVNQDWAKWWNLWLAPEGLAQNIRDYSEAIKGNASWFVDDLNVFRQDLHRTVQSMFTNFNIEGWDADQQREAFEKTIKSLAQQMQLSVDEYRIMRIEAEEQYSHFALGNAKQEFESRKALQETFFQWLSERQSSEVRKRLGNLSKQEIEQGKWLMGQNAEWVEKMAQDFSKQYNVSFNTLKNLVDNTKNWSIYIPVYFGNGDQQTKSLYDQLTEADKNANAAYSKIQRIQTRINELTKSGGDTSKLQEELKQAEDDLKKAEDAGGHASKQARGNAKAQKTAEQEVSEALRQELSIIREIQSNYDKLRKSGVDNMQAVTLAAEGYESTLSRVNQTLAKYGINKFNAKDFAGKDTHALLEALQKQQKQLIASGKLKASGLKEIDVEIQKLVIDAKTYDMKKITDGLNSELSKIKDEYELAVELDANPELGGMFAEMFGIDTNALPRTFGEAFDRANAIAKDKLRELKVDIDNFDLLSADLNGDKDGKWMGIDVNSEPLKELIKWQKTFRDMFKKNMVDTEKMLDDYVKKYGDYADKIGEIEKERLNKVRKLNEAYFTEEMRQTPDYTSKLKAINTGAEKEKQKVEFDAFKDSRYYTALFENLDYVSTKTLRDMRDRLVDVMNTMNELTPEQLKHIMSQYEKLEQKIVKRRPFQTLAKDFKAYVKETKERKQANQAFRNADKEYRAQQKVVAELKEKYEQAKANTNTSQSYLDFLKIEIDGENEILEILKEQLDAAQKKADKYNLVKKLALEEATQTATMIADNLKSMQELRDNLQNTFNFEFSAEINGMVDGLAKAGDGISKVVSSAQNLNVFGMASGVVDIFAGIGDGIASIFGDGSARTKRLQREIEKSEETVRQLNMAYKDLERAVSEAMGAEELRARRSEIANKKAELAEIQRQMELERSKRSKDRDDDKLKSYEERIQDLQHEIKDLTTEITSTLLGSDVKSAAESFVSTWVNAWREGGDVMGSLTSSFDDMIDTMIAKSVASRMVANRLQEIWDAVDQITSTSSEGGASVTMNELKRIKALIGNKSIGEAINEDLTRLYEALGIAYGSGAQTTKELSALQQGIQGVTEDTAGAVEAYLNGMAQQAYLRNDLLTQIRDTIVGFELDTQVAVMSQILLQLQNSYTVQMAIQGILEGWSTPSGMAVRVELN